jgi:hypothetical protein
MNDILLYLDPGSSSMIIQMIVAGALGAVFFIKNGWYRIKSFFTRSKPDKEDGNSPVT